MTRGAVVLRPAPGNAATAARLEAAGIAARRCPLFAVVAVDWNPPPLAEHDALLLTSANAPRHAGARLAELAGLPVLAVGAATATAAQAAGLTVALAGIADAAALVAEARARGWRRPLHLGGRERGDLPGVIAITVYASDPLPVDDAQVAAWAGQVVLLHSLRAARRFITLVERAGVGRASIDIAALSSAVAEAAGPGWRALAIAASPRDDLLVDATRALIDPPRPAADKRA